MLVCAEHEPVGESLVFAEAQNWPREAGRLVRAGGGAPRSSPWILGGGQSQQNCGDAGHARQPLALWVMTKGLSGLWSRVDSQRKMAFHGFKEIRTSVHGRDSGDSDMVGLH